MSHKIQFTQEGYQKLTEEFTELHNIKRPQAVLRLQKARAMGDLSENSEYSAAKEEMAFVEGRIREVEELMDRATIIVSRASEGVTVGTHVTIKNDGKEETYTIVGEFEANPMHRKISITSPIGKALCGKQVGDTVVVDVPAGKLTYTILSVHPSYDP